ncbi:MAG: porin [Formosimonas sp.]
MKKTLLAAGLLAAFGVAHAESSVTLYGHLNMALTKKGDSKIILKSQEYRYASHLGLTGKEDLGNGYSAIFKLEAELQPDIGSGAYGSDAKSLGFNRHSYVGLVTPYGAVRFGRSTSPFVNMWVGGNFAEGRGIGEFTGGVAGTGLRTTNPEVAVRWNNALFYDIKKGGLTAGLAVTTKGATSVVPTRGEPLRASEDLRTSGGVVVVPRGTIISPQTMPVDGEGKSGGKSAYGAYARYEGKSGLFGYKFGAAYQVDNGSSYSTFMASPTVTYSNSSNAPAEAKKAWVLGTGLSYGPVNFALGYARATIDNTHLLSTPATTATSTNVALQKGTSRTLFASLGYDITPRDHVYVSYGRYKRNNTYKYAATLNGEGEIAGSQYSAGYEHRLSKRTVLFANVRKVANITNSCSATTITGVALTDASATYVRTCGISKETVNSVLNLEKGWSYDLGISHSF